MPATNSYKTVSFSRDQYNTLCHALADRITRCEGYIADAKAIGDLVDEQHYEQQLLKAKDAYAQVLR